MKEFYVMEKYSELLKYGNYITEKAKNITEEKNKEENKKEYERINKILMPELFKKIYKLLREEEKWRANKFVLWIFFERWYGRKISYFIGKIFQK